MVGAEWWLSNAVGGVKVMVMQKEAFKARQLLRASTESEDFKVNIIEADAAESRASCPHCGSHNIIQKKFSKRKALLCVLLLGFPLFFGSREWSCFQCQHEWKT